MQEAQAQLSAALTLPSNEARLEAQILLQHCLDVNRAWLIAHENDAMEANNHAEFEAMLKRRLAGEPIAYILGKREFYGLEFKVTPDTLIPRPDTETLVEAALERIPNDQLCRVLDLGTGTGAIAIAIAKHRPHAQVTAVDQSSATLAVAEENARNLLAPHSSERIRQEGEGIQVANLRLLQSDWFSALASETFDVIVSNPPYVAEHDPHLQQGDLRFEPMTALSAGKDGLDDIRRIIQQAPKHLAPGGWLMLEHGYDQADRVSALLSDSGFVSVNSAADLGGILRVTYGKIS
ncbi:MAG TPA: peptide chain release factor N(5)-glutamine methyltransferase [Methylophilaceae bacterium]|nr:peptide chain release factor N(5)-glutamine methyltransferase [Methylophilaceae bacterium]